MSYFDLDPTAEQNLLNQAAQKPAAPEGPGFFAGSAGALFSGLASGGQKIGLTVVDAAPLLQRDPMEGTVIGGSERQGEARAEEAFQRSLVEVVRASRPDQKTTGLAGEVMFGLGDVGVRAIGGTLLGGPLVGAGLAGITEGVAQSDVLQAEGIDPGTAAAVGAIQGVTVGVGAALPAGVGGSLATRIASGAGINVTAGMVSRGATAAVLERNGYLEQAAQYQIMDTKALLVDGILGAAFGGLSGAGEAAPARRPVPSEIAAAAATNEGLHLEVDTAPGLPATAAARDAHADNMARTTEALLRDEPPPALRDVDAVPNVRADEFRAEVTRAAAEVPDRRQDATTRARIADMTPEQQAAEITWLRTEQDRLNNELRTDPLTGLGNKRAWAAVESDPRLPVKAMLDVDSLKWVNDNLGHEAGDAYLQQIGEAIRRAGGEQTARLGGDEFAYAARTPEAADALAARINEELAQVRVEATLPSGEVVTKAGAGVSYGRGATRTEADANLYRNKQERTTQGLRSERGTEPLGVKRQQQELKFTTAKGSEYVVHSDGTTTRNKAARPEHPGESGPQPRSERTFYVTMEDAIKLGEFQAKNPNGVTVSIQRLPDGRAGLKYETGKDAGKFERRTVVQAENAPREGLIPVETWKNGTRVHFGNEITGPIRGTEPAGVARGAAAGKQGAVPGAGTPDAAAVAGRIEQPDDGQPANPAQPAEDLAVAARDESAALILADQPDLTIQLEDGTVVRAADAIAEADAELALAQQDAGLFNVAVSCFLRYHA